MVKAFAPVHGLAIQVRQQWRERDVARTLGFLITGRPPLTGEPEIDAIIIELYSHGPQKL